MADNRKTAQQKAGAQSDKTFALFEVGSFARPCQRDAAKTVNRQSARKFIVPIIRLILKRA